MASQTTLPKSEKDALPGRATRMAVSGIHRVHGHNTVPPFPGCSRLLVALGCFWGAERRFWQLHGVHTTAVGYAGGFTPNPTYEEVCSGLTGHTEAVLVAFDPERVSLQQLLQTFWTSHDPTQGMRQGADQGTQYRSALYLYGEEDLQQAEASRQLYQEALRARGLGTITTEIARAGEFFYAEDYHQQYLAKNPNGYCGLQGTGVPCPA